MAYRDRDRSKSRSPRRTLFFFRLPSVSFGFLRFPSVSFALRRLPLVSFGFLGIPSFSFGFLRIPSIQSSSHGIVGMVRGMLPQTARDSGTQARLIGKAQERIGAAPGKSLAYQSLTLRPVTLSPFTQLIINPETKRRGFREGGIIIRRKGIIA